MNELLDSVANALAPCSLCGQGDVTDSLPDRDTVITSLEEFISVLFPGCHAHGEARGDLCRAQLRTKLEELSTTLTEQCRRAFRHVGDAEAERKAHAAVQTLFGTLPEIRNMLIEDIRAAYEGDPAACSETEVVMSYPAMTAITAHRLAHTLYLSRVPLIPRIMGEWAHSKTGIDIHPGATIGPGFFIDHGTGVVIGETCVIGRHVKLYQGVTLGALSFEKEEDGSLVKGVKRHPNVEDDVVIYAGATILGGGTTIGRGSVIGGNVWLIHSVPPGTTVYNQTPKPMIIVNGKKAEGGTRKAES